MSELWPITSQVLGVFLVMLVGAGGRRLRWLTAESDRSLAQLTANVLLPALFFHRIVTSQQLEHLSESLVPPLLGFAFTALGFGLSALVAWSIGPWIGLDSPGSRRAFALCTGICNYGYIPLPLAEVFYPDAVVPLMVHNVGVDLAMWSVGVLILSGSIRQHWKRAVLSPPLLAVVLAVAAAQTNANSWIPEPVLTMVDSLGRCAIPMGLVLSGAIMLDYLKLARWRQHKRTIGAAVLIRQGILPACMLSFAWLSQLSQELDQVLLLQAAMPAATFPIVLVRLFDQDTGTALRVVLGTSLLGLITIPLWLLLGRSMGI